MKNFLTTVFVILLVTKGLLLNAQPEWITISSQKPEAPVIHLINSTSHQVTFTVDLNGF